MSEIFSSFLTPPGLPDLFGGKKDKSPAPVASPSTGAPQRSTAEQAARAEETRRRIAQRSIGTRDRTSSETSSRSGIVSVLGGTS